MVLGLLAMTVMPLAVGDAWAVYRNYYFPVSGHVGFAVDFIATIQIAKYAYIAGLLAGGPVGWGVAIGLAL